MIRLRRASAWISGSLLVAGATLAALSWAPERSWSSDLIFLAVWSGMQGLSAGILTRPGETRPRLRRAVVAAGQTLLALSGLVVAIRVFGPWARTQPWLALVGPALIVAAAMVFLGARASAEPTPRGRRLAAGQAALVPVTVGSLALAVPGGIVGFVALIAAVAGVLGLWRLEQERSQARTTSLT